MTKKQTAALSDRMKQYEHVSDPILPRRLPVMVRLDGNSFSQETRRWKLERPYDLRFHRSMWAAAKAVLSYASGAQIGYVQSDEITVLLRNDQTLQTEPFLGGRLVKLTSLLASRCSVAFNRAMREEGIETDAIFDARAWVVPEAEVVNVFLWRQLDAFRNCVLSVAQAGLAKKLGKKEALRRLHGLNIDRIQEVLFSELGLNINDLPVSQRRGVAIRRVVRESSLAAILEPETLARVLAGDPNKSANTVVTRASWETDLDIPRFNVDRGYIEGFLGNNNGPTAPRE